ncbi:hypothetical protein [Rossellomorea sp. YZS02]|uniref:hypothetical protein n=1 Tax=Rossellomorea sp. YZS02 TaxID=3097358 RepID=UPI002A0ED1BA|nr:hypothetical protein [Rossellomorea sp. YZS02]MDX8342161.1 hypothetical protein [Rossellomorea sp. YZS02]
MSERTFQLRLWLIAVLGSIALFVVTELIWEEVPDVFLLVYLVGGFIINHFISKIRNLKSEKAALKDIRQSG